MLSRYFHLTGKKNFDRATKKGKIIQRPLYAVCIYDRGDVATHRFGFVISKKISKLAVQRNRIRRAMEDTIRYNLRYVPIGIDIVFLIKKEMANKTSDEIMRDVEGFLRSMEETGQ
jgi:ribonuclease P protein component